MIEQLHDFALVEIGGLAGTRGLHRRHIVGDAAGDKARILDAAQRFDHLGAEIAGQQRNDVAARHFMAQHARFGRELLVEGVQIGLGALEPCPGILQMIGGVDLADEIFRQTALALVAQEGFERRGGKHPAEIPDHRFDHTSLLALAAT